MTDDYPRIAQGVRDGKIPGSAFSAWMTSLPELHLVLDGEFADDGSPLNVRPIVLNHATGAAVSVIFTDADRAAAWRDARDDRASRQTMLYAAPPAEVFLALLELPIDGIVINPGDPTRLNAGRAQIESLARYAGRSNE